MGFFGMGASAGLVIRTQDVELLVLQGGKATARVRVPLAGSEKTHLVQAIRQAIGAADLKTTKLAVAIPTKDVLVRFFTLPIVPKTEWEGAVQFEAPRYVPFKPENLVWDYHVLESKETKKLHVVFTAIQRAVFQQFQAALAEAGVTPTSVEPSSLSLARLAVAQKGRGAHANEYTCLVDLEAGQAHLVIAKGGVPYLTRDILLSEEATPAAEGTIDPRAQRLLSELRVSMDFFTREHPSAVIPSVLLFGDEALIGTWQQWLSEQLRCVVTLGKTLMSAFVSGELSPSFAVALGLARRDRERAAASLDFLKRSVVKTAQQARAVQGKAIFDNLLQQFATTESLAMVAMAAIGLISLWLFFAQQVVAMEKTLAETHRLRQDVGFGLSGLDQQVLEPLAQQARTQVAMLQQMVDQRGGVSSKLDALARLLPDGVWLTGVTFEERPDPTGKGGSTLRVSGACYLDDAGKQDTTIRDFEARIKSNPVFGSAGVEKFYDQVEHREEREYTYRAFELNARTERKL